VRHPETLSGDMTLELPEFADPPADPIALVQQWSASAEAADVREPRAATLATADAAGRVSARIVLVKGITGRGILFGFSGGSRKGSDTSWILALDEIEFWHGDVGRFHRRLQYRKAGDGYQVRRLQP
jgi:pyridoxamine 5'-phosphate oxidase